MHKNDIVGWVVLAFLIVFGIIVFAGIGAATYSPHTVTCNYTASSVSCTR